MSMDVDAAQMMTQAFGFHAFAKFATVLPPRNTKLAWHLASILIAGSATAAERRALGSAGATPRRGRSAERSRRPGAIAPQQASPAVIENQAQHMLREQLAGRTMRLDAQFAGLCGLVDRPV